MTDSEAFAFHFAELDRRGLDGPVPEGWVWSGNEWTCDRALRPHQAEPCDHQALAGILTQALADAGNLTIHTTRDGTNTVTTPAFAVHRKPLLAGLVLAYWKMRGEQA